MSSAQLKSEAHTSNSSVKVKTEGLEHATTPATNAPTSSPLSFLPPSSLPPPPDMAADKKMTSSEAMPPPRDTPARKRSSGEMQEDAKSSESSQTVIPKLAQLAQQGKFEIQDIDSSAMIVPNSQIQGRLQTEQRTDVTDAPLPSSVAHSQAVPPSAQGQKPKLKAQNQSKAGSNKSKNTAKEQVKDDVIVDDENVDDDSTTTAASDDAGEPQDPIQDFDWNSLHGRYQYKMTECRHNERVILQEFGHLVDARTLRLDASVHADSSQYFHIWAQSGNAKESERSLKRLKTQEFYVHHEEDDLERKREHYTRVVAAFQIAHLLVEHSPNLAKDLVIRELAGKPSIRDKKSCLKSKATPSASIPEIMHKGFSEKTAGDIDMRKYRYRGHHASRCVIL
ncbi:hypothetical protein DOTSEDRAFT_39401 [Dothistroma septosporum NZE10]|uniref:Uncharacterized protein n=1 Tax=Dothistroma septosporum (strain NZE10 / CBS 128990) TaxID=675120 RepID=N1PC70_DOTSN|nr:hypothetical protein DOTSEDRAFT_39401 [Dothistroma septosporum NZE10]